MGRWSRWSHGFRGQPADAVAKGRSPGRFELPRIFHGPPEVAAPAKHVSRRVPSEHHGQSAVGRLRVMSLNIAHGRANGLHQLLQGATHRLRSLTAIATLLERERPDIVAMQEVDGPSWWSGGFCHVDFLAERGGFPFSVHGAHVEGPGLRYGTGLLSRLALSEPSSFTFGRSFPTPAKGFTFATAKLDDGGDVDIVSVHLDFLRTTVRRRQVAYMSEVLSERDRPLVVMGDFNASWADRDSAVASLATSLGLVTHEPQDRTHTFPAYRARIDWILISPDLEFERHEILPDIVSDHLPVVADLRRTVHGRRDSETV